MILALEPPSGNDHAEASGAPEVPEEIIARLQTENAAQKETIATLLAANAALMARVVELERRLGLNSSNSGKPPTGCTSQSGSRAPAVCASHPANRPAGRRRRDLAPGRRSERHHRSLPRDLCGLALTMATRCSGVRSARAVDRHRASGVSLPLRPVRRGNPGAVSRGGHGPGAIWPAPPGGLSAPLPTAARGPRPWLICSGSGWWRRPLPG